MLLTNSRLSSLLFLFFSVLFVKSVLTKSDEKSEGNNESDYLGSGLPNQRKLKLLKSRVLTRHGDRTTVYKPKSLDFQKKLTEFFGFSEVLDDSACSDRKYKIHEHHTRFGIKFEHYLAEYDYNQSIGIKNNTRRDFYAKMPKFNEGYIKKTPIKFEEYGLHPKSPKISPSQICHYGQLTDVGVSKSIEIGKMLFSKYYKTENSLLVVEKNAHNQKLVTNSENSEIVYSTNMKDIKNTDYFSLFSARNPNSCLAHAKIILQSYNDTIISTFLKELDGNANIGTSEATANTKTIVIDRNLFKNGTNINDIFSSIQLRSTHYERTIETIEAMFLGFAEELMKENKHFAKEKIIKQIPLIVEASKTTILVNNDNQLHLFDNMMKTCQISENWKKYHELEFVKNLKSAIMETICKNNSCDAKLIEEFPSWETMFDIFSCRSSHYSSQKKGILPPDLLIGLQKIADKQWSFYLGGDCGPYSFGSMVPYLDEVLRSFKSATTSQNFIKLEIDGAHDASLAPILRLFDLADIFGYRPNYNSHLTFELFQEQESKNQQNFYVSVSYDGRPTNLAFCAEKMGDLSLCTLEEFENFINFLTKVRKLL